MSNSEAELHNANARLLEENTDQKIMITESEAELEKNQRTIATLNTTITTLESQAQQDQQAIEELQYVVQSFQAENEHLGVTAITSAMTANHNARIAEEAQNRAALAEGVAKHSQRLDSVDNQISVLTKQNEVLQIENNALRKTNEVLALKNQGLQAKISTLEKQVVDLTEANLTLAKRVSTSETEILTLKTDNSQLQTSISQLQTSIQTLETDSSAQNDKFTTRDAMRDLEFFVCREACLAFKIAKRQIQKRKLYCFQNLRDAKPDPVPLPTWLQHGGVDICLQIKDFKDNAGGLVHVRPVTKDAVEKTIAQDSDDDEDKEAKKVMMLKLSQYYTNEGTAFGVEPKR